MIGFIIRFFKGYWIFINGLDVYPAHSYWLSFPRFTGRLQKGTTESPSLPNRPRTRSSKSQRAAISFTFKPDNRTLTCYHGIAGIEIRQAPDHTRDSTTDHGLLST